MSSTPNPSPVRWERLEDCSLVATRVFDVRSVRYRHASRAVDREFYVIQAPDWVNVLALTPAGELVLVRQFRFGVNEFSLEIPGGVIDRGEDPVEAGLRELREETGFAGGQARLLASVHPNPAILSNRCHFVLVEGVTRTADLEWDPDEELAVEIRPLADVLRAVQRGEITHALVLDALLHLALARGLADSPLVAPPTL